MARDSKDKTTLPLIPEPKKVGRPSTGSALTPAQRKAQQRQRDREKVGNENLTEASITALCERLQKTVSMGDVDLVKGITLELMKRARLAFKDNVTVTKTKPKAVTVTKTKSVPGNKSKPVTVTKTKPTAEAKAKPVTVTKKPVISTAQSMAITERAMKARQKSLL